MENKLKIFIAGCIALLIGISVAAAFMDDESPEETEMISEPVIEPEVEPVAPKIEYGMTLDSFEVVRGKIETGVFLSDLLDRHHISPGTVHNLVNKAKPVFDIRRMVAGKNYTILCSPEDEQQAQFFIYEPNAVDYVVFDLRDDLNIYKGQREITIEKASASGIIESSLYQTLVDNNNSPALAMEMASMYAWSIDFYRIQKRRSLQSHL